MPIIKIHIVIVTPSRNYFVYDGCNKHLVNTPWDLYNDNADEWFKDISAFILNPKNWLTISQFMSRLVAKYSTCHDPRDFQDQTKYFKITLKNEFEGTFSSGYGCLSDGQLSYSKKLLPLQIESIEEVDHLEYELEDSKKTVK